MTVGLALEGVAKRFGDVEAVRDVTFAVAPGETVAVLGPSGCGKSTVLHLIAGLERPDAGDVLWNGESIVSTPPHRRGFGLMFQDFALFPHMDVYSNIAFGPRMAKWSPQRVQARTREMLALVGLEGLEHRDVANLSGGEKQRVALARSMAPEPRLLMLDEPLGSLDRTLRERLMLDLARLLQEAGQTAIYVTHDQEEAFAIGRRVVLMREGRVVQSGTPQELYRHPRDAFAARFLGLSNVLEGEIVAARDGLAVDTAIGSVPLPDAMATAPGGRATVLLRPDAVALSATGAESGQGSPPTAGSPVLTLFGRVREISFRGPQVHVVVDLAGTDLIVVVSSSGDLPTQGETVRLDVDLKRGVQRLA